MSATSSPPRMPRLAAAFLVAAAACAAGYAQMRATPVPTRGAVAEEFARRRAASGLVLLMATAHPDDEDNALAALLRWKYGVRVVLWTMTRGESGQNEIGLEQGEALKLLRDEELAAAHRFDGIEQFRLGEAPDFGYSFSVAETMEKWRPKPPGRGDARRVLQAIRPQVVLTMHPGGDGGGQHHQTSAQLMIEECRLDRNPWREDGRADDGAAWHVPRKLYATDPSNWTAAGTRPASRPDDGPTSRAPVETVDVDVFEPLLGRTFRELAAEARSMHKSQGMSRLLDPVGPPTRRVRLLIDRTGAAEAATRPNAAGVPLFGGVSPAPPEPPSAPPSEPAVTERPYVCRGESVRARSPDGRTLEIPAPADGDVVPGVEVRSAGDVFAGEQRDPVYVVPPWDVRLEPEILVVPRAAAGGPLEIPVRVVVRRNAAVPGVLHLRVGLALGPDSEAHSTGARIELAPDEERRLPVVLRLDDAAPALAEGQSVRVLAADGGPAGPGPWEPAFGNRVVDYPHVRRRLLPRAAETRLAAIDLMRPPRTRVGYVRGVGEASDVLLAQLGADVSVLGEDDLAEGDLDRFDVLVIGARAYEFRADLRAHHARVMERVARGGVLVCQYQKAGLDFARFAPKPAKVGAGRVTDEAGPVTLLATGHPLFVLPNAIGPSDWEGWVRDRSLYHLEPDPTARADYVELLSVADTFGSNAGPHAGALVEARVGRGRWIYCGLALWRQLPEGVPGAWRLWANLLALR